MHAVWRDLPVASLNDPSGHASGSGSRKPIYTDSCKSLNGPTRSTNPYRFSDVSVSILPVFFFKSIYSRRDRYLSESR